MQVKQWYDMTTNVCFLKPWRNFDVWGYEITKLARQKDVNYSYKLIKTDASSKKIIYVSLIIRI